MPPGYDDVLGASTKTSKPQNPTRTTGVMKRLGTPAGKQSNIPNITRTISNPHKNPSNPHETSQEYRGPVPQTHTLPYPPASHQDPSIPYQQQQQQTMYSQPAPTNVPPYPVHQPQHPPPPPPVPSQYAPPAQQPLPYPPQDPEVRWTLKGAVYFSL